MKKIMILGGSMQQIPAIQYAREKGYYTILCDYLEGNPGRAYSDEYHCVSTTDKDAILAVAKRRNIDAIVAFAADTAAITAAYVGNKLNLPSNSYESVLLLADKGQFREFLERYGFNCPKAEVFTCAIEAKKSLDEFEFPLMLKPVDSSGSIGISRIDNKEEFDISFELAINCSKKKMVIIEEYIEMAHECIIGGDMIVTKGEVRFYGILNGYRGIENNSYVPIGNSYPSFIEDEKIIQVQKEMQKVIDILGIKTGVFNIDVMFDKDEKLYIIEINARNGGIMMSELLRRVTDVDLAEIIVEMALDNEVTTSASKKVGAYYSTYNLHSKENGRLKDIIFDDEIKDNIIEKIIYKEHGENVEVFDGLNKVIGIILLKYSSLEELKSKMNNMDKHIKVELMGQRLMVEV